MLMFLVASIPIGSSADSISTTKITNSKGHSWSLSGSNIQLAINDLGSTGGTVYIPATTGLLTPALKIAYNHIPMLVYCPGSSFKSSISIFII